MRFCVIRFLGLGSLEIHNGGIEGNRDCCRSENGLDIEDLQFDDATEGAIHADCSRQSWHVYLWRHSLRSQPPRPRSRRRFI